MLRAYPSITDNEFAEACQHLEQKCHDNLHNTAWDSVQWCESHELRIMQSYEDKGGNLPTISDLDSDENLDIDFEDSDMDTVVKPVVERRIRQAIYFSVLVSPTYRVPVLWFSFSSTPQPRLQDLDEIYSSVVAPTLRLALQNMGIMGGISIAHHPISDRPMFFVHPCNTQQALAAVNSDNELDPFHYLLLWIGIVGSAVGLHVPSKLFV